MSSDAERPRRGPDGSYGDWRLHDDAESEAWMQRTEQAIQQWGSSFVAWLLLPDSDPTTPDAEDRFVDGYAGWYPNRQSLMRAQLETLGWNDALAGFLTALELPAHALGFNWDEIWRHCLEIYDIEERLPGIHAFLKGPDSSAG